MSSDISVMDPQKMDRTSVQTFSVSSEDSDTSKDLNRNSKKFADNNLSNITQINNPRQTYKCGDISPICTYGNTKSNAELNNKEKTIAMEGMDERGLNQTENYLAIDHSVCSTNEARSSLFLVKSSTPILESSESPLQYDVCSISPVTRVSNEENNSQTYLITKTALKPSSSLTNKDIEKKFQDLSFAFETDSITIEERLTLMKRKRDQAETNVEKELEIMETKLKNLQYLGLDSDCINLISDLQKQLDFVHNAMMQLSSSAESYGYVQHEEKQLEFVTTMVQYVDIVESEKNETSKILEKLKNDAKRPRGPLGLESEEDDDRLISKRSMAAIAIEGTRRRASIATLPRIRSSLSDNVGSERGSQWSVVSKATANIAKKFSSTYSSRNPSNIVLSAEDLRRNSVDSRFKDDSRVNETSMKNIDELPEQKSMSVTEPVPLGEVPDSENIHHQDSFLHVKQFFESFEEIKTSSVSQDTVNIFYCLRRIIAWSKLLLSATRFRWPDNVWHYFPFYITWYIVFVLALVFIGGVFTGINGCYTYLHVFYSPSGFAVFTFFMLAGRFYRFWLSLMLILTVLLGLAYFSLTKILLPSLTGEEIYKFLNFFGSVKVGYVNGPPPI